MDLDENLAYFAIYDWEHFDADPIKNDDPDLAELNIGLGGRTCST